MPGDVRTSRRKAAIFTGLGITLLIFVLNDLFGLIAGGGIFSILSVVQAAHAGAPSVDVDEAGLRTLFVAGAALLITGIGIRLRTDMGKRLQSALFILSIYAAGFILDAVYGPAILRHFMAGNGYARCAARDHVVGNGKSRVWFDDYVLRGAPCPAKPV